MLSETHPLVRRVIRFAMLPYYYVNKVDWEECKRGRIRVALDLLYMFFRLRSYPENYTSCRLWEKPRNEWSYYFGSSYNPWARHHLRRDVQPYKHLELFVDKSKCDGHFRNFGIPMPRTFGMVATSDDLVGRVVEMIDMNQGEAVVLKPVRGACGRGVAIAERRNGSVMVRDGKSQRDLRTFRIKEDSLVQAYVRQHHSVSAIFPNSVNTIRVVVLMTVDNDPKILGSYMRFGKGASVVDNVFQGGVSVGISLENGEFFKYAYNSKGRRYEAHPDTGYRFEGFQVPFWDEILDISVRAQRAVPFYKLIGLDVAVSEKGPLVIEINGNADMVALEQRCGPLLRDREILREFKRHGLLYNRYQQRLFDNGA